MSLQYVTASTDRHSQKYLDDLKLKENFFTAA